MRSLGLTACLDIHTLNLQIPATFNNSGLVLIAFVCVCFNSFLSLRHSRVRRKSCSFALINIYDSIKDSRSVQTVPNLQ